MTHADFVHLHLHTEYSLLDGAIRIEDLVKRAKDLKLPALAITDHSNIFGAYEFFEKAKNAGVKPILGCEMYVAPESRFVKASVSEGREHDIANHLVLLVKDETGYRNLCVLLTAANFEGFYYKPRIDKEILKKHSAGLIALSACLKGEISSHILRNDLEKAKEAAAFYKDLFKGDYYFEIQENGIPEQRKVNDTLLKISKELGIPLVATNDCHYLNKEDFRFHDILLCIQTGKSVSEEKRMRMSSNEYYMKTPEEMKERFKYAPEAISNTIKIAESCYFDFKKEGYHFPDLGIPKEEIDKVFMEKVYQGFEQKIPRLIAENSGKFSRKDYEDRLKFEIEVIQKMGFPGYFIIVADFIEHARKNGIPVGPGRGSAAGSFVSYCLGITTIDPLRYNLLFERFLNPDRKSMPDVDVDFSQDRRGEVINYIVNKYGKDMVSQIITFGSMKAKLVVRDVARAMDIPYADADRIAKLIGSARNIKEALETEPLLSKRYKEDAKIKEMLDFSMSLEKLPRHASTHAAGVVIADRPLVEYMPLYKGKEGEALSQFPMKIIESMGLIKFDILGLKTLTMIEDALRMIEKNYGIRIDLENLALDDPRVYELFSRGDTTGIFQFESAGMKENLMKLKPTRLDEIIAMNALYRPGPMEMIPGFIARKHGKEKVEYDFPELEEILKDTYGIMVYQEQVMLISMKIGGFSRGDADVLRKVIGKKDLEKIPKLGEAFINNAAAKGFDRAKVEKLFDQIKSFGLYGFNKSHSAAYAYLAYHTAYIKAHYPQEFTAALLTSETGDPDKFVKHINESRESGIKILPPDINESDVNFTVDREKQVRFGLAAIKNVGKAAVDAIIEERSARGRFTSFYDFLERVSGSKVNKKVIESLIKSGALDSLGGHRGQYLEYAETIMQKVTDAKSKKKDYMNAMFEHHEPAQKNIDLPPTDPLPPAQILAFEKEVLGFYVSGHPLYEFKKELDQIVDTYCDKLRSKYDNEQVAVGGIIASLREARTKKGDKLGIAMLEDLTGTVEVVAYPKVYEKYKTMLNRDEPVYVKGKVNISGDGEGCKIVVDEVMFIKDAWSREIKSVHLAMNEDAVTESLIRELKSYFTAYQGKKPIPVVFDIFVAPDVEVKLAMPKKYWVEPTIDFCKNFSLFFSDCRLQLKKTEERFHG